MPNYAASCVTAGGRSPAPGGAGHPGHAGPYLRWLGTAKRKPAKAATLARRLASIAGMHRIVGFGEIEPLPTQAGMARDTLKGLRRAKRAPQRQAAPPLWRSDERGGTLTDGGELSAALLESRGS
ncbi:hypothetical protein EP837_03702 (plasmid) [Sphingobium sp. EP60837]|nr:hypothetical protein EP837_03702 [Sphingobium sp. EP60837]